MSSKSDRQTETESEVLHGYISELEEKVKLLERDLIHDALTGLKTRKFFEQEAHIYFDIAVNAGDLGSRRKNWFGFKHLSFVFIDIDHFKEVNDTLGHLAGDEVLKSVAETVRTSVRDGDTAARWGGEEIVVTLVGATENDALNKAEEIRRQIETTRFGRFPELRITVSAGVATATAGSTLEEIIERADKAMYFAKRSGRNKAVAYSSIA